MVFLAGMGATVAFSWCLCMVPPIDRYPIVFVAFLNNTCVTTFQVFLLCFFFPKLISLATSAASSLFK